VKPSRPVYKLNMAVSKPSRPACKLSKAVCKPSKAVCKLSRPVSKPRSVPVRKLPYDGMQRRVLLNWKHNSVPSRHVAPQRKHENM
jgi:hypothetical protein